MLQNHTLQNGLPDIVGRAFLLVLPMQGAVEEGTFRSVVVGCTVPECRSCPGVSPQRCFAHAVAKSYPIRTVIQLLDVEKTKEPITQSIKNRREHNSRFKMMFYVIGSENSKSGSAFLLLSPTEPKAWWSSSVLFGAPNPCRADPTFLNMVEHFYSVVM